MSRGHHRPTASIRQRSLNNHPLTCRGGGEGGEQHFCRNLLSAVTRCTARHSRDAADPKQQVQPYLRFHNNVLCTHTQCFLWARNRAITRSMSSSPIVRWWSLNTQGPPGGALYTQRTLMAHGTHTHTSHTPKTLTHQACRHTFFNGPHASTTPGLLQLQPTMRGESNTRHIPLIRRHGATVGSHRATKLGRAGGLSIAPMSRRHQPSADKNNHQPRR